MQKVPLGRTKQMQIYLCFLLWLCHKVVYHISAYHNINAKARSIDETFTVESSCELPPPPLEVKINGMYVLLLEMDIVMVRKQLEKPENTMVLFMKLETNDILNMFVSTFGWWYSYPLVTTLQLLYYIGFFICSRFMFFFPCCCPSNRLVEGLKW